MVAAVVGQKVGAIHELSSSNMIQVVYTIPASIFQNLSVNINQNQSIFPSLSRNPHILSSNADNNRDFPQDFLEMNQYWILRSHGSFNESSLHWWRKLQSLFRWRKLWTQLDTAQERAAAARKIQALQRGRQVRRGAQWGSVGDGVVPSY